MTTPAPRVDLPQARAIKDLPLPPIPEHLQSRPSTVQVLGQSPEGVPEIAIIAKRTLQLREDGVGVPAEVQVTLGEDYLPHPPLPDGSQGTPMVVPEVFGYRSGTDLIIRAHARPERPSKVAMVSVRVGPYAHRAVVQGDRHAERAGGRIVFSEPKPFENLPLRFELAYGGQDEVLLAERIWAFRQAVSPADWRLSAAFLKDTTDRMPGIAYPRNRFGRGYVVLDRPARAAVFPLPNLELPDDLLTPERLIAGARENWHRQPVPAGFDFLEPAAFPRTAMVGLPPTTFDFDGAAEVKRGQVPRGYCRGNAVNAAPADMEKIVNLDFVRNAAIGLRFGFLRCGETILLSGMRHDRPEWAVRIPERPPDLRLTYENQPLRLTGELHQVLVDVDARRMELVWVGRRRVRRAPAIEETPELARRTAVDWNQSPA
jgi:hypothetical protein